MALMYANDALLYLRDPRRSLPQLMTLLENFGEVSELKVNWTKSYTFSLHSRVNRVEGDPHHTPGRVAATLA